VQHPHAAPDRFLALGRARRVCPAVALPRLPESPRALHLDSLGSGYDGVVMRSRPSAIWQVQPARSLAATVNHSKADELPHAP
jgi:hypothetical protein